MRLKLVCTLLFCLFLFYCQVQEETRYYPSKELYDKSELVEINLDTTSLNFKEIKIKVDKIYLKNKRPLISINDNGIQKRILPLIFTEYRKRDVLSITSDSILIDNGYSIDKLKSILERHYSNNEKDFNYPRSYKKALVEITMDTSMTGNDLKRTLLKLTKTFDEINSELKDTLELQIFFEFFRQIPPPPILKN